MSDINYDHTKLISQDLLDYADKLGNSDKIRLAAYVLSLADAIQQKAKISNDAMIETKQETMYLFDDVEDDDETEPGYHVFRLLGELQEDFEALADNLND